MPYYKCCTGLLKYVGGGWSLNQLTLTSDQERVSPYNINTISNIKQKSDEIEKNINYWIIRASNARFSELTS